MTLVLTADALVAFLVGTGQDAEILRSYIAQHDLAVADGTDRDAANILNKLVDRGQLAKADAATALHLLDRMQLTRHEISPYLARLSELISDLHLSSAAGAALAEALGADLITLRELEAPVTACYAPSIANIKYLDTPLPAWPEE